MHHGGDIYSNRVSLDFSVNISPLGIPKGIREAVTESFDDNMHYPDPSCRKLKEALSARYGVSEERIFCGNGASEVIFAIASAVRPERALVMEPTFSGYERALRRQGTEIIRTVCNPERDYRAVPDLPERLLKMCREGSRPDLVFLCNPNNPVGNCMDPVLLADTADCCREEGIFCAVDECFLEFLSDVEERMLIPRLKHEKKLIVLRAITKLYAVPGLRLGYAFTGDPELVRRMQECVGEWNVSIPAQQAGIAAMKETEYVERVRRQIKKERPCLENGLRNMGFEVFSGVANFIFFASRIDFTNLFWKKEF